MAISAVSFFNIFHWGAERASHPTIIQFLRTVCLVSLWGPHFGETIIFQKSVRVNITQSPGWGETLQHGLRILIVLLHDVADVLDALESVFEELVQSLEGQRVTGWRGL